MSHAITLNDLRKAEEYFKQYETPKFTVIDQNMADKMNAENPKADWKVGDEFYRFRRKQNA